MFEPRATWRERLITVVLVVLLGSVLAIGFGLDPLSAGLIAALGVAAFNVAFWRARGVPLREVYG